MKPKSSSFSPGRLAEPTIPIATGWLLGACMEARGKQDLWLRQKPETLAALREQAMIQSVESSNRIEGVTVKANRLRPLLLGRSRPRDRSEEELLGYRKALDWIFSRKERAAIQPRTIQRLHALSQGGFSGDAGKWKARDNEIIEILSSGERRIRFLPVSAKETPHAIETLCLAYRDVCEKERLPPLLAVASFVLDFLCIHPFRDGNGRVSRLLTSLLLVEHGFSVGRFISLERLVEDSKKEYYQALERCSQRWHEGRHEIVPWWNYFLGTVRRAYAELEQRVESAGSPSGKSAVVRQTILSQSDPFSLAEIRAQMPMASLPLIKKVLAQMKSEKTIDLVGRGRGARWRVLPSDKTI